MKKVSEAELEVLKVVWRKQETTSNEIIKELNYRTWNDNTIRTLINRLIAKKAIGISKREGKNYTYVPLIKLDEYREFAKKHFLSQFFDDSAYDCVKFLIEKDEKLREEIALLLEDLKNNEIK